MKKLLSLALVLLFVLSFSFCEAAENIEFASTLTNLVNDSSYEADSSWIATSYNRALATELLILDVAADSDVEISKMDINNSYIGRDEYGGLVVFVPYSATDCLMIYYGGPIYACYGITSMGAISSSTKDTYIELLYKNAGIKGYKNTLSDIGQVISDLREIFNS